MIHRLTGCFLLVLFLCTCSFNGSNKYRKSADTYVLIHGGFHSAWCWDKLKPLLEKRGFHVVTPSYRVGGKEFFSYADSIGAWLTTRQQPVILLGHSSGGMVISELAKRYPDKIKGLVYLSAFLLPEGMSPPQILKGDSQSIMQSSLIIDEQNQVMRVDKNKAKRLFYEDCDDATAHWAIKQLRAEPLVPHSVGDQTLQEDTSAATFMRRFYIETLDDRALGIASQRKMQALMPCEKVYTLKSGHSPFLSQPDSLAAILAEISLALNIKQNK